MQGSGDVTVCLSYPTLVGHIHLNKQLNINFFLGRSSITWGSFFYCTLELMFLLYLSFHVGVETFYLSLVRCVQGYLFII
jgi:hypothetical protein